MSEEASFRGNLGKSLTLKIAASVLVAVIIAVGVTGTFYLWSQVRVQNLSREARLHRESMIALEAMQKEALEFRFAIHKAAADGNPEFLLLLPEVYARIEAAHSLSHAKHIEAEVGKADAESEEHMRLYTLYSECMSLHSGINDEISELLGSGAIVEEVGAPESLEAELLAGIDADFASMQAVDREIETILADDVERTAVEQQAATTLANYAAMGALALALVVGLTIAYASSRRLVSPVRQMVAAANRMADGDLSQEVQVRGADELSHLGKSFNAMARALDQRTQQLEHEKGSMRAIHQSIGDGIVVLGNDGTIVSLNPAAEKALGQNAVDLEGKTNIGMKQVQHELERPPIARIEMLECWEVKKCTHPECPSYESSDRRCWLQCGTHCYNQIQGTFRQKRDACERCDVFQANAVRQFETTIEGNRYSAAIIPILDDEGQQEGRTLVLHDITAIHEAKKELEKHSAELEELQTITKVVSGSLDLKATLAAGLNQIYKGGKYDALAIYLRDGDSEDLALASVEGFEGGSPKDLWRLDSRTAPARALASKGAIIIEDLRRFERCPESLRRGGILSAAIIPLQTDGSKILGVMCAGRKELAAFHDDDKRLLSLIAAQISIAVKNAMLYEDKVRYSEKMLARNRIVSALTKSLVFEDTFETFAAEVAKLSGYDRMSVVTVEGDKAEIKAVAVAEGAPGHPDSSFSIKGSVFEQAVSNSQTIICNDLGSEAEYAGDDMLAVAGLRSCMIIPLVAKRRVIGTLNFYSKAEASYNEGMLAELQPIADQLALALANQDLFEHVARAKAEWEKTFDAVGEGIVVVDEEHRIVRLNRAAAEMMGGTVEEITGTSCRQELHHLLTENSACALEDATPGKASTKLDTDLPDGRMLEVIIDSVFDEDGRFSGGVHFLRDVTEQKQMRQRMMTSEKMVAVGQLVSGVAHEINNPLTGIAGYAQLLMMREDLDEKTRQDAEAIAAESDRATRIVRQLLSFARKHQPERYPVNINNIIRDCIGLKGYDLKVNNVEISTDLDDDLPDIAVDQHQIQQVFINLITNAEQAIHENGRAGVLRITSTAEDDRVRITFTDDGPGVPPEKRNRLFDPFYTTKDVGQGTGLGLSVCYGIIQEHDGSIWVEGSEDGEGAIFIVELPVLTVSTKQEQESGEIAAKVRGRILVVDDEQSVREVLAESLRRAGHEVDVAENGEAALRLLGDNDYDSIVSDVKMPVMNGAELHLAVKSINPEAAERFIFISGDTVNEETRHYLERITNPSLTKPFGMDELETALQAMLDRSQEAA